jgi:hypothetical protein
MGTNAYHVRAGAPWRRFSQGEPSLLALANLTIRRSVKMLPFSASGARWRLAKLSWISATGSCGLVALAVLALATTCEV